MEFDYDVVVIGAGGAGMSSAIVAHDCGASVLIVEAGSAVGGSTALSGGVVFGAGTSVQRAAGILYDSAEQMYGYYMTLNQWKVDPAVAWRYCQETAPTIEWLLELGVEFPTHLLHATGVDGVARSHEAVGEGLGVVTALERAVKKREIDIVFGTRVDGLVTEDGRVVGIRSGDQEVLARTVILASGGFGHNRELLQEYYPDAASAGDLCWSVAGEHSKGDGLIMGRQLGASIAGFNRGLLLPTTAMARVFETPLPAWLMLVNSSGMRFVDENAPHAVMTGVMRAQHGPVYGIFDERMRLEGGPHPENVRCARSSNFTPEAILEGVAAGAVHRADSLDELGELIGLPVGSLAAGARRQTEHVARGADSEFFKSAKHLQPVESAPFYAVEITPGIISFTSCGLRIDVNGRVLDTTGTPIPGFYAAGEVTGNVNAKRYPGGGNGLGNGLNFGRIAGEAAASEATTVGRPDPART